MVRINLLGEKKDNTGLYVIQAAAAFGLLFIAVISCFFHYDAASSKLEMLTQEKEMLEGQAAKLRERTKKVLELEKKKKLLSEKLTTIAKLKVRKQGPVRVLDDLTLTIPERSWLTNISQKGDELEFRGVALDPQTVSLFMRSIKESKYFEGVDLIYSREYVREGVKLQQFSLSAKLANLLKLNQSEQKNGSEQNPA